MQYQYRVLSRLLLSSVLCVGAWVFPVAAVSARPTVDVLTIVEHPSLDAIRDGIRDELKAEGFTPGKTVKWEYQSAQGSPGTAAQIARVFVGSRPAVIVAITTPAAQAVLAATKHVPLVFAGVTDPVAAQLITSFAPSGSNVTGVSDKMSMEKQVAFIQRVLPKAKRVGIVYNPGEANSVVVVKELQRLLPPLGMSLVEAPAPRTVDIPTAASNLVGKVDVIYTSTDNNVVSAYESLVKVANAVKIPLIASDTDSVKRGALAALGINQYDMGRQAGKIVGRVLKGEKPGTIAAEVSQHYELYLNLSTAEKQGVIFPPALLKEAKEVIK